MAYGVRWFSEFDDIHDNVVYRVEVRERDYAGVATKVLSEGSEPLTIDMSKVENVFTVLRPQKATVKWMAQEGVDFQISDLYIDDDRKYQLLVFEEQGESLLPKWFGWVVPIELEEPFASKPYPVTFSATCGLPFLSDDYLLDGSGSFVVGKKTLMQVIANCLTSTGMELDIDTYIALTPDGVSEGSPLSQAEIDADGLRGKYADETLAGILAPFRAYITQANGKWVIKGVVEQNALETTWIGFDAAGNQVGTATVNQAAGIGRTAYSTFPHLRPTAEVVEKIAEPNSIVTETVSPGIPVNRLANGLFAGPVLGGTISGWNNHMGGIPWARQGFNKPDDPYRVEFYQHIELDPKGKKVLYKPWSYFDSGPIELNLGDFNIPEERRKETKIVLSAAFRMHNILGASIMITLNEDERDFASYLTKEGDWYYSKKEARDVQISSNQTRYDPNPTSYEQLETQSFELESKRITNYLKIGDQAVVKLRIRIFPGIQFPNYIGGNAFLSIEDLSVIVVEDSVFEGEHKYQIDAHLPIRNANEVEFTSIIADKIDITTPEQSRDVNRVMTGYMTLAGSDTLTTGWRYPGTIGYQPIQKLALHTTLRQLAGKRNTLDGNFLGYDVTPDISLFNRYSQPGLPSTFYSQTSWRWNVKDGTYDISATELNLFPLPEEDLYLYDDQEGRRGNRMYRGNTSAGTGGQNKPEPGDEIVFDDIPPVYFTVGEQAIRVVDLAEYLVSAHEPYELTNRELHYTDWVSYAVIDRGEDGLDLKLQITALPKVPGTDRVLVEFVGPYGEKYIAKIDLVAVAPLKVKNSLLEISGEDATVVGPIPGSYEVPSRSDISVSINGTHDFYQLTLEGGGDTGTAFKQTVNQFVESTSAGTYRFFQEDNGFELPAGNYRLYVYGASNENPVYSKDFTFVLYDEEFLAKAKLYFTSGGADVGEMDPAGTSKFPDPGAWDNKIVIDGVEHDTAILRLIDDSGSVIQERVEEIGSAVTDGEYLVYGSDQAHAIGIYTASITLLLAGEEVFVRYADFETVKEVPAAVGDELQLLKKSASGVSFSVVATLPKSGVSAQTLVPWNIGSEAVSDPFDWEGDELFELKAGSLIRVDISSYTGRPQYVSYPYEVTFSDYRAFDNLSSEDIGKIHGNNKTFRYIRTRKVGGQSGDTIAVFQADFSFGTLVPIGDDVEVEEPGTRNVDYVAGAGMSETTVDYIKRFDNRVDNVTIEIFEPEMPDDPDAAGANHLRVRNKGITFPKLLDIPGQTLIGKNTAGTGTPFAVPIRSVLDSVTDGIPDVTAVKDAIAAVQTSTYMDWNLVNDGKFKVNTNPVNSPTGNASHGLFMPHYGLPGYGTAFAIRNNAFWFRSVENSVWQAWLQVADRTWVNAKQILTGTGLAGGGDLSAPRTLSVLYGTTAGTAAQGNDIRLTNGQTANDRWISTPVNYTDINVLTKGGVIGWGNTAANRPESFGTILNFVGGSNTGDVVAGSFVSQLMSGTSGNWYVRYGQTGVIYQMWTTKQFSATQVANWDTVAGRSVTAGLGLTGGAALLASNPVITLGTPSTITNATTNNVSGATHTHALQVANLAAGSNVSLSASGTGVILGTNNITISVNSFPWPNLTSKPTTLIELGVTDLYNKLEIDGFLIGKENVFSKGNLVQGANIVLSGTLTNRLIGAGDVTFAVTAVPWSIITSKPTTVAGYGLTDAATTSDLATGLAGKENSFSKGSLIQGAGIALSGTLANRFVGSGDVTVSLGTSGVSAGTYRSVTVDVYGRVTNGTNPNTLAGYGLDSTVYTKAQVDALIPASSPVTVSGVSTNRVARWTNGSLPGDLADGYIDDDGSIISFLNPAKLLNVTYVQRTALSGMQPGCAVWQTNAGSGGAALGLYVYAGSGSWIGYFADYIGV